MKYLFLNTRDVHINLATEEYLFLKNIRQPLLLLYINAPSVVLGRYQNIYEELNIKEAEKGHTPVARRISGGGTVFHDLGNLNYSYICPLEGKYIPDYDSFLFPVINALNKIGVPAHKQRGSDIAIDGKKISGSAQKANKNTIMHHGTLLYNADLDQLKLMLKAARGNFVSKSVKSVRSKVCNIKDHLQGAGDIEWFAQKLINGLAGPDAGQIILTDQDRSEINHLAQKYLSWEWNWAKSPKFSIGENIFTAQIEDGMIKDWVFKPLEDPAWSQISEKSGVTDSQLVKTAASLKNKRFSYAVVSEELEQIGAFGNYLLNIIF